MRTLMTAKWPFIVGGLVLALALAVPAQPVHAHSAAEAMATAANEFLAALDPQQREKASYEFKDQERQNWHFIPKERDGLPLKEMKPNQQQLAYAFLQSALSHRGFHKALNVMALEQILHEMENNSPRRDPLLYHFFIFGKPSTDQTWGWRVEGHHLSVNITLVDGQKIVTTPSFFGANPAEVRQGPQKGLRVLAEEEDRARRLLKSLSDQQRQQAVIATEAPEDVINGPGRDAAPLEPKGVAAKELNEKQQRQLLQLIRTYVFNYRPEMARQDLQQIRQAGFENIHFAWAGGTEPGQPHYYRVQGPTFILEYDNTQNEANHIHTVWRDFKNDFGQDLLKQHYEQTPHGAER